MLHSIIISTQQDVAVREEDIGVQMIPAADASPPPRQFGSPLHLQVSRTAMDEPPGRLALIVSHQRFHRGVKVFSMMMINDLDPASENSVENIQVVVIDRDSFSALVRG